MSRVCELCGTVEADAEELDTDELSGSIEMLFVCDTCRRERREPEEG